VASSASFMKRLLQAPMPDSSQTGGKSETGRDRAHTSRVSRALRHFATKLHE
jgi:hypothetical protein